MEEDRRLLAPLDTSDNAPPHPRGGGGGDWHVFDGQISPADKATPACHPDIIYPLTIVRSLFVRLSCFAPFISFAKQTGILPPQT